MALYPPLPDLTFQCQKQSEIWVRDYPRPTLKPTSSSNLFCHCTDFPFFISGHFSFSKPGDWIKFGRQLS